MRRVVCLVLATAVLMATDAGAQPEYLRPLLREIATGDGDRLLEAYVRLQERTASGLYDAADVQHIVAALIARAESSPEHRPDIITILGQLGMPAAVPFIIERAQAGDDKERLHAFQALGWLGDERALPVLQAALADASASGDRQIAEMVDYAAKAILIKRDLMRADTADQYALLRTTMIEEPNWLVRADVARLVQERPGEEVWPLILDSVARWRDEHAYVQRISAVLARRYALDSTGFLRMLADRPVEDRLFGLQAVRRVVTASDMGTLMQMVDSDPDRDVRELAAEVLSELLSR